MDPSLEAPSIWPDVHHRLIESIADQLAPLLRPRYFVGIERRLYVLGEDDPARRLFVPDVTVLAAGKGKLPGARSRPLKRAPSVLLMAADELEVAEPRLVIHTVGAEREVVTVVEVLSPANKTEGSRGREEYLAKRRETLRSAVHLVEVDLLRAGARFPSFEPLPRGDYYVHVSSVPLRPRGEVFAWGLREEVPEVPIPLKGDEDAILDLARALRETYERAGYDLAVDYRLPPMPALATEEAAWADDLLRRSGRLTSA